MRIVSWNVFFKNKKIKKGIRSILSLDPDVICLQEVPNNIMPWLSSLPGYTVSSCFDWKHKQKDTQHAYVCTLTKNKPVRVESHVYDNGFSNSLLTKAYASILHNEEQHMVLVITLTVRGKRIQIANTRLSCAIGTHDRLQELQTLIKKTKRLSIPTIYCGDFNVIDNKLVNRLTGWMRGYKHLDYLLDERGAFEELYRKEKLINIFRGKSTTIVNRPIIQLDHILTPFIYPIISHELSRKRYGSDHKILFASIKI